MSFCPDTRGWLFHDVTLLLGSVLPSLQMMMRWTMRLIVGFVYVGLHMGAELVLWWVWEGRSEWWWQRLL